MPPMSHLTPGLAKELLDWYDLNARPLPWRAGRTSAASARPDPYAVLVSETMLQQTTVAAAAPCFSRWMETYPTVESLAAAPAQGVLRSWEGLGYYSRARNLHAAAIQIVRDYGGKVPSSRHRLSTLPGIGAYTAGAVASIAFGERAPAVDANVLRVLCRLAAFRGDIRRAPHRRRIERLASRLVCPARPGDFNQALMDLGSLVCTPREPGCPSCPIGAWCRAFRSGQANLFPARWHRPPATPIEAAVGVVTRRGQILVVRRPAGGLFAGMWEFPGGKVKTREQGDAGTRKGKARFETAEEAVVREVKQGTGLSVNVEDKLGVFSHSYTRYRVALHVFVCAVIGGRLKRKDARWVRLRGLDRLPMPAANRRIVKMLEKTDSP